VVSIPQRTVFKSAYFENESIQQDEGKSETGINRDDFHRIVPAAKAGSSSSQHRGLGTREPAISALSSPKHYPELDWDSPSVTVIDKTLLSFARRIGKHNIRAARETEEDSIKRRQDIEKRTAVTSRPTVNSNLPPIAIETTSEVGNIISDNERAWLNETAAAARTA
jgi:hypothetical protein